ncbi:hypothetical protein M3231_01260 [Neobacillus mesonae]|nr:hypothetical protein [Neobacillus mesonae]
MIRLSLKVLYVNGIEREYDIPMPDDVTREKLENYIEEQAENLNKGFGDTVFTVKSLEKDKIVQINMKQVVEATFQFR